MQLRSRLGIRRRKSKSQAHAIPQSEICSRGQILEYGLRFFVDHVDANIRGGRRLDIKFKSSELTAGRERKRCGDELSVRNVTRLVTGQHQVRGQVVLRELGIGDIPIINALSDLAHPCQALGDLLTMQEDKGSLATLRVAYVGDGNNIASSLALACASVGADFVIAAPKDYHVPTIAWEEARHRAAVGESLLDWVESPQEAVTGADIVYTDTWISMGDEAEVEERRRVFATYQVNEELMKLAKPDASFMHDMPAHRGEEISENMLDDPSSIVFHQAENRLHAQKAILAELFAD